MFIDHKKLLEQTNGGLEIILKYYPDAEKAAQDSRQKFKMRSDEKTPSASLKKMPDGNYIVTDWGEVKNTPRNGIQICMKEEGLDFRDAVLFLAKDFGIAGEGGHKAVFQKDYEQLPAADGQKEGDYLFEYKEYTNKELAVIGPGVTKDQCLDHKLYSLKSYTYVRISKKTGELVQHVFKSNENYPIFQFVFEDGEAQWGKRLEPKAENKADRFRYFGERPSDYIMGIHLIKRRWRKENADAADQHDSMDEREEQATRMDKKLPEIIICGGDRDALSTEAAINTNVVWFNSETAKISKRTMKELETYAYKVYYLGDIDSTGLKVQHKLAMEHLDLHLVRLPEKLQKFKDHRGNPCKDVRDFLEHFNSFQLKELVRVAIPYRMWDIVWKKDTRTEFYYKDYAINPLQTYNFLEACGFYRFKLPNVKTGYVYIHKKDGVIEEIDHVEIKAFVNDFLKEIKSEPKLRNAFYKSRQYLGEQSLSNLSLKEIDFTDYTPTSQLFFFKNQNWEVSKEGIREIKAGEVTANVWADEVIKHKVKKLDDPFTVTRSEEGEYDIKLHNKDCLFLQYLINTSRVHWQEEKSLQEKGIKLSEEKDQEQRLHLINKIYSLGYLLHRYKDPSRPWAVFAMDNKISDDGESHGGSGKSIAYKAVRYFMKSVSLEGRNPKLTENPHVYENVTSHTNYILVDDANKYLKFDFFYSQLTGEMTVNPKHGKQYEIPFEDVPKLAITSNFALRDDSPSTYRRLLFSVFSDYYHEDKDGEYGGSFSPKDEFGKNLFMDFTEEEWNLFINTMAHCLKVYLSFPKIDPPMGNVTARNQITQMTQEFKDWADVYFGEDSNADKWIVKTDAYTDFLEKNRSAQRTFGKVNRFKKSLKIYCKYKGYILNPEILNPDSSGRLVRTVQGKSAEHFYVQAHDRKIYDFEGHVVNTKISLDEQREDDLPF
tara:strand:+ start:10962 stop:13781 length:2820 start_codon:yes stop_codon:yes gene_type:complete